MKSPKKPSKELSLPSQDESRRTNVLFEKLMSEFRAVAESVSAVRERVDRIEPKLDKRGEDIEILKAAARTNGQDISALKDAVRSNTEATRANTDEIRSLKGVVEGHTTAIQDNTEAIHSMQTDLKTYNQRLEVVEAKLAS